MSNYSDHEKQTSTKGEARTGHAHENEPAAGPVGENGQHAAYWVLSEEERAKGFVRPVRTTYKHGGIRPTRPTRPLTPDEAKVHGERGYVAYEKYDDGFTDGRFWTQDQLDSGCGAITTMSLALAETYARDPEFYGATFCCKCRGHFPVAEFTWDPVALDGKPETVGS